jgi:putative photosynthetic complex assembly protein
MSEIDSKPFPRGALIAAASLVGFTVAFTGAVSAGLIAKPKDEADRRVESHMAARSEIRLQFADATDGALLISDAATGRIVRTVAPGDEGGFIRGVLRSMARERRMMQLDKTATFRLVMWQNSSLSLTDPDTGRTIELDSFGTDNRAAFAALLPASKVAAR